MSITGTLPKVIVSTLFLLSFLVHASSVTLDSAEINALRLLVAKDANAGAQFGQLRKVANSALLDRPNPVSRIIGEGHLKSEPENIRTNAALKDMEKMEALAWAWVISKDDRFAVKAREFIKAWAVVNQSDGNPINETKFEPLIEAYDLVRLTYPETERDLIDAWLRNKANLLWSNSDRQKENWQSHRLKIVGLIATTIGDRTLWKLADEGFKKHIEANFEASGVSQDFKRRDALHYHLYSIQPLLTLACVAKRQGESLFTYRAASGASLKQAVEFVKPYAFGEKKQFEFAKSQVKFDRTRALAGEKEYKAHYWNPKTSVRIFAEAGCVDFTYNQVAATVAGKSSNRFVNWRSVLNSALAPQQTR